MIASSLREGEDVIDILLKKEAGVNVKSTLVQFELSARKKRQCHANTLGFSANSGQVSFFKLALSLDCHI